MQWILLGMGTLWVMVGTIFILYTPRSRWAVSRLIENQNPKLLAIIPLTIGILLVIPCGSVSNWWYPLVLGVLAIGKGTYLILGKRETKDRMMKCWLKEASETTYRFFGIVWIVLGIFLVGYM